MSTALPTSLNSLFNLGSREDAPAYAKAMWQKTPAGGSRDLNYPEREGDRKTNQAA